MSFSENVVTLVRSIPPGKVATYGQIAAMAGNIRGARAVVRVLHSSSRKYDLPWHRVIAAGGRIALKEGSGREEQLLRLQAEGVYPRGEYIDLSIFLWRPTNTGCLPH